MFCSNFLSPIDEYSDLPFRLLCQQYGAQSTCVPLVNATAIARVPAKAKELVDAHPDERNLGVQIVGNKPEEIAATAKTIAEEFPFISWLNINCGCPSMRTMNSGGGSAFLEFPDKIAESVQMIKKAVDKQVSVKIRIKNNLEDTFAVCKKLESAGVDFLIIHGRTAQQGYSGKSDWEFIKSLKGKLSVPLVGNGDITSMEQGENLVKLGYCDSFMIARAAMSNPMVFAGEKAKTFSEKYALLKEYIALCEKYLGKAEVKDVRVKAVQFMNSLPDAASLRSIICRAKTIGEILSTSAAIPVTATL